MIFVRSDDERVLWNKWNTYIVMKETIYENSAINALVQNEHSERMKDILLMKLRIIRI